MLKRWIGLNTVSKTCQAIKMPNIKNGEWCRKSIYRRAESSSSNNGTEPLPSNGGKGSKLKIHKIRFNEKKTLKNAAAVVKIPGAAAVTCINWIELGG